MKNKNNQISENRRAVNNFIELSNCSKIVRKELLNILDEYEEEVEEEQLREDVKMLKNIIPLILIILFIFTLLFSFILF